MESPLRRRIKADYTVLNRNVFNSFLKAGSVKLELLSSFVNEFQKVGPETANIRELKSFIIPWNSIMWILLCVLGVILSNLVINLIQTLSMISCREFGFSTTWVCRKFMRIRSVNLLISCLQKGSGYHLDLLVITIQIAVCSLIGTPWFVAATVLSINHIRSLTRESESSAPGERPKFLGVRLAFGRRLKILNYAEFWIGEVQRIRDYWNKKDDWWRGR